MKPMPVSIMFLRKRPVVPQLLIVYYSLALLNACATVNHTAGEELADIRTMPQQPSSYGTVNRFPADQQAIFIQQFKQKYFAPWFFEQATDSKEEAMWGTMYFEPLPYGENLRPHSVISMANLFSNANYDQYDTEHQYAISVTDTDLRVFPTDSVLFKNPERPGEGFPFDYNQATLIAVNTPLYISHYSEDGLWALVESNITLGWVPIQDIALVDERFIQNFMTDDYAIVTTNKLTLKRNGRALLQTGLGTLLSVSDHEYRLAIRHQDGYAALTNVDDAPAMMPLGMPFNTENVADISEQLVGEPYGWGGLYHHRDCSMLTRDFFLPFGIFLHRNSRSQLKDGQNIDLSELTAEEKKQRLLTKGQPFKTLLYMPGHILLYVGQNNGEPVVFHAIWSIRTTRRKGSNDYNRKFIGKAIVSTLELGKERSDYKAENSLLNRIETMVVIQPDDELGVESG